MIQPFTALTAFAAPLPAENVDTDAIVPARFMKTLTRSGLGAHLFHDLRYEAAGAERPDFVLNRLPYRNAAMLVAYENFGCGSSREHAPWALLDFGIRCVIAPSFGDIFAGNCLKNGILPVRLGRAACKELMRDAEAGALITVDLEAEVVAGSNGRWTFATDPFRRELLLRGDDDIDVTLRYRALIDAYEARHPDGLYTCAGFGERVEETEIA
jgi:3-isopropylmalate/(R)-2-methylmalate dehydratase small subunit